MAREASADPGRLPALSAPGFVGRARELAALGEALAARPTVVLVEGEAGVGKSRLLREFFATPLGRQHHGLVGTCPPLHDPHTLGPVVDAVRGATDRISGLGLSGLAGALRAIFPEWTDELPPAPEPLPDPTAARHRLFRAFVELIDRLAVTVLTLEDVHWADEATLELLLFLVSRQPQPVSVVVTYRPGEVPAYSLLRRLSSRIPPARQLRLALSPLDVDATSAFVSSMLAGEQVSAEFAAFLHQRTDGLPLAIEESVRLMHDRADLTRKEGGWVRRRLDRIDAPPTIRDAVLERVARLDDDTRSVLRAAAVLADPAASATVATVAGLPGARFTAGLSAALESGLLREDARGLLSFRHGLFCQVVYEAIPAPERRHGHLLAGRSLAEVNPPPATQLVRHFRESGQTPEWCRYTELAVDLCQESGDETAAGALLHRLITSVDLPVDVLVRLVGKVRHTSLRRPRHYLDLVRVLESALHGTLPPRAQRGAIRFQTARMFLMTSAFDAGRQHMEAAMADLPPESVEAARARITLGLPLGTVRPAGEHLRWLRQVAEPPPSVAPEERLALVGDRILGLLLLGEETAWAAAQRLPEDAASPRGASTLGRIQKNLAHLAMLWGRYPQARVRLAKANELVGRHQVPRHLESLLVMVARLDWLTGDWAGLLDRTLAFVEDDSQMPDVRGEAALVAGLLRAAAGDHEQAEAHLLATHAQARRRNAADGLVESAAALAELWLAAGRVTEALAITDDPIEITVRKGIWVWSTEVVPVRVVALLAAGRSADASALVDEFGRACGDRDAPGPRAALASCHALLAEATGDATRAAALFARAAEAWAALPRPYDALLARERRARCLIAAGQPESGLPLLSSVFDELTRLGARHRAGLVRDALRGHGVDVRQPPGADLVGGTPHGEGVQQGQPRRPGRPGYGDQLSPREQEVVTLLLGGRTNRQIAEALVVSRQTVASHLHSAMRKLRVSSRTALALRAVELGLTSDPRPSSGGDE
ncbi:AAA family ATPase [Micromonospora sp. NPDC047074]|uniref:helix-turn-helix transcriptional regulator n=1 Tax=Micromonospora sp. NPDC047074 TaxID=3154339 RepID=UPI0033C66F78